MDIAELKTKNIGELFDMAEELNLDQYSGLRKQDLLVKIESELLERGDALTAEGVLELLPEGYGFLRSQEWNYVYSPDDIYVSPSQVRRFGLRTGCRNFGHQR